MFNEKSDLKIQKYHSLLSSILLLFVLSASSSAQTNQDERLQSGQLESGYEDASWYLPAAPREEIESLKARWGAIAQELRLTSSEFAGTYFRGGEMRQSYLRWSPDNGFVYVYVYENFSVLDFSYGRVQVTPSEIIFTVEREQRTNDLDNAPLATPNRWIPAKWKRSRYMISVDDIDDFGNYVAGLGQYNDFNGPCCEFVPFFVTSNERASENAHRPIVPNRYAQYLREQIEGRITFVGRRRIVRDYTSSGELYGHLHLIASLTPVRVNIGRRHGVRRNLLFRLIDQPHGQFLKITRVGYESSSGVIVRDVDESGRETCFDPETLTERVCPPLAARIRVTTSPR